MHQRCECCNDQSFLLFADDKQVASVKEHMRSGPHPYAVQFPEPDHERKGNQQQPHGLVGPFILCPIEQQPEVSGIEVAVSDSKNGKKYIPAIGKKREQVDD